MVLRQKFKLEYNFNNTPSKSRTEKLVFLDVIGDDVRRDCALNGVTPIQLCLHL